MLVAGTGLLGPDAGAAATALTPALETALRDKRRALGRALAAGVVWDDAKIDDELLFVRAVADVGTPHIRLLARMASERIPPGMDSGSIFHGGWSLAAIAARAPGPGEAVPVLLSTLESHGLVRAARSSTPWQGAIRAYDATAAGGTLLERQSAEETDTGGSAGSALR